MASNMRAYQEQAFWALEKPMRRYYMQWLRQGGKTTTLAKRAVRTMMKHKGRLVTFASATLNIGSEMVEKGSKSFQELLEKEAKTWQSLQEDLKAMAAAGKTKFDLGYRSDEKDEARWKVLENTNWEKLAECLESNKLEMRLWHSKTVFSRLKVIAADVRTARSWSGDVMLDEAPFVRELRTLIQEMEPIFSTDPSFTFLMAGTLPADTSHYAYELGTPANGQEEFGVDAKGHWFKNRAGLWVHQVSVDDAAAAGRKVYDPDTGAEQTVEENREMSMDREGWDRSNRHKRPTVGANAISPITLDDCMRRGRDRGFAGPDEPPPGWLDMIGKNKLALGLDLATTTKKLSNPTSLTVAEKVGSELVTRLVFWWKTSNPQVTKDKCRAVLLALKGLGRRASALNVDATNERFFATELRSYLSDLVPVNLIVGGEGAEYKGESMTMKAYLGNLLANSAEDGRLSLPSHFYLTQDFGRVLKSGGTFEASLGTNGEHGDTFDSTKLAIYGLIGQGETHAAGVSVGNPQETPPVSARDQGRFSVENAARVSFTLNS